MWGSGTLLQIRAGDHSSRRSDRRAMAAMTATQVLMPPLAVPRISWRAPQARPKEMTRGLGGPRVKRDWRVREAEGGFCAPVCKVNAGIGRWFRGGKEIPSELGLRSTPVVLNADQTRASRPDLPRHSTG